MNTLVRFPRQCFPNFGRTRFRLADLILLGDCHGDICFIEVIGPELRLTAHAHSPSGSCLGLTLPGQVGDCVSWWLP